MDDGLPPPSDTASTRPTTRPAPPKKGASKSNAAKSGGSKSGNGSSGSRTNGSRSVTRSAASKAKPVVADPRRESLDGVDVSGSIRRRTSSVPVIDDAPTVVVDDDDPVTVDDHHDEHIDRVLADDSGRIELPTIVPAETDPELHPDTEPTFAPEPEPSPELVVAPVLLPPDESIAVPDEWTDTDGTDGLPSMQRPPRRARRLHAPVVMRRGRRPRVRRVTRVVRQIDTWSVFKVALVFNVFLYGVVLTAGVLLWKVAQNTGTVDNVQRFFESFGWKSFTLHGGAIFHQAWVAGLFGVVGLTGFAVLVATLFNLITDLVGGIRVTVLEEEVIAREDRGLGWRRASRSATTPAAPSTEVATGDPPPDDAVA